VWPAAVRRPAWIAGAVVLTLAASAAAWLRASPGDAVVPPPALDRPLLATGASFNVTVAPVARDQDARALAVRLGQAGMPAYDWRVDGSERQVLLGPFVSIDEAEAAQGALRAEGFRATRLHVDERLRTSTPESDITTTRHVAAASATDPAVVLVAAPGRVSLALELLEEPREVGGRRVSTDTYEVVIRQPSGSLGEPASARLWSAPDQVALVRDVTLQEIEPGNRQNLRLRLTVSEAADVTVRTAGQRVYVDLSRKSAMPDETSLVAGVPRQRVPVEPVSPGLGVREARAAAHTSPVGYQAQAHAPSRAGAPVGSGPLGDLGSQPAATTASSALTPPPAVAVATGTASGAEGGAALDALYARFEEMQPFLRSAVASPDPVVLTALRGSLAELDQSLRAHRVPQGTASSRAGMASQALLSSAVQLAKDAVAPDFTGDRAAQVREAAAQFAAAKQRGR
jgi:hypothetical protein